MTERPPGLLPATPQATRPCKHCTFFGGWAPVIVAGKQMDGASAWCLQEYKPMVFPLPQSGCVHWKREVGTDDDLGESPNR